MNFDLLANADLYIDLSGIRARERERAEGIGFGTGSVGTNS